MSENRKHARIPAQLRCWCEGNNVTLYARITNLSEGGLFLRTSTPLATGSKAVLRLTPGGDPSLQTTATVMWLREEEDQDRPPGMGLRFEQLDEDTLGRLRRLISQQQSHPTAGRIAP